MLHPYLTFTVAIPILAWMGSVDQASMTLLASFFEDIAEGLPLRGTATSCLIDGKHELWFTFLHEEDKNLFLETVQSIWLNEWTVARG